MGKMKDVVLYPYLSLRLEHYESLSPLPSPRPLSHPAVRLDEVSDS